MNTTAASATQRRSGRRICARASCRPSDVALRRASPAYPTAQVVTSSATLSDLESVDQMPKAGAEGIRPILSRNGIRIVNYEDWLRIDAKELTLGAEINKPREKLVSVSDMLTCID